MNKTLFVCSAAIALVLLGSCGKKKEQAPDVRFVNVVDVTDVNAIAPVKYAGKTKSAENVNVSFRVSGAILKMHVKEGDHVRKGQVIADMDPRDYQLQANATQAEYEQIKADCERVIALYNEGNTTAQNYDKARYGLQQITQKLSNHKNQLADTRLVSPIDGYVQTLFHEAGETVGAGMPIVSLFSSNDIEVEIKLPSSDFSRRDKFSNFNCSFDILPGVVYPLEVTRTSQEANTSQLYTMRLRIKGNVDRNRITPGLTTMVTAHINNETSGLYNVPSPAVFNDKGQTFVFVYNKSSHCVEKRAVHLSFINSEGTTTIDDGLKEDDKVVASGVHHLKDGDKVELIKADRKSNVGGLL